MLDDDGSEFLGYHVVSGVFKTLWHGERRVYARIGVYSSGKYTLDYETEYFNPDDPAYKPKNKAKLRECLNPEIERVVNHARAVSTRVLRKKEENGVQVRKKKSIDIFSAKYENSKIKKKWQTDKVVKQIRDTRQLRKISDSDLPVANQVRDEEEAALRIRRPSDYEITLPHEDREEDAPALERKDKDV